MYHFFGFVLPELWGSLCVYVRLFNHDVRIICHGLAWVALFQRQKTQGPSSLLRYEVIYNSSKFIL
jgi:hypothetical protein